MLRFFRVFKRLGEEKDRYYYKVKYKQLRKEFDQFREFFFHRLSEIEKHSNNRLRHLESKVKALEAHKEKTEVALRILEAIEPHRRNN